MNDNYLKEGKISVIFTTNYSAKSQVFSSSVDNETQ